MISHPARIDILADGSVFSFVRRRRRRRRSLFSFQSLRQREVASRTSVHCHFVHRFQALQESKRAWARTRGVRFGMI